MSIIFAWESEGKGLAPGASRVILLGMEGLTGRVKVRMHPLTETRSSHAAWSTGETLIKLLKPTDLNETVVGQVGVVVVVVVGAGVVDDDAGGEASAGGEDAEDCAEEELNLSCCFKFSQVKF